MKVVREIKHVEYMMEGEIEHFLQINFMVTPCIDDIPHFIAQLMHTTLKNAELLNHFKIK
jgi:TusA-related sulfurtransferase